jgi:hypothetical protein
MKENLFLTTLSTLPVDSDALRPIQDEGSEAPPSSPVRRSRRSPLNPLLTSQERAYSRHGCSPSFDARYLNILLDTNTMRIPNLIQHRGLSFYTNQGAAEEYERSGNYKGGLHLIMRSLASVFTLSGVSVLPSIIDISDFKTPALDYESHAFSLLLDRRVISNIQLYGNPVAVSEMKKNLYFVYSLFSGIAYIRLYADDGAHPHHQAKARLIQEYLKKLPQDIRSAIDVLMNIRHRKVRVEDIQKSMQALMLAFMNNKKWVDVINNLLSDLYTLDSKVFYEKNASIIDSQYQIETDSVSVFYWISRMMRREILLKTNHGKAKAGKKLSAEVINGFHKLEKTRYLCNMPIHVFVALNSFFDYIYCCADSTTLPNKVTFKQRLFEILDTLYSSYTEEKVWYADPSSICELEQTSLSPLLADMGYSLEALRASTQQYLINNKAMGQLIDDKFDVNDFALCLDAIHTGMPILTRNVDMQEQVWGNLARALIIGRDVQFIVVDRLLENAQKDSIEEITVMDLTHYCEKYLDTRHLWSLTNYQGANKLFPLGLQDVDEPLFMPNPSPRSIESPTAGADDEDDCKSAYSW